ncbi:hypothetical protein [[Mycobacterium] burgundiense]|uniref:FAD-binding domain-containing protein n=1 Tax=[Mycobacterium] burgundiense TaxID=3064286 RepID=A0ABM9M337_9MYCO|nr:hypothetical protein [Mycolicibacterium sp. MU0053]CAJ1509419.1 hypothetical protein MU0053_004177 [Mycolicibacterium sp. MU0053]
MADGHRRGRRSAPEPQHQPEYSDDSDGFAWDDAVDVVCVGLSPVAAAAAVAAANLGWHVCRVRPARELVGDSAEYLRQVTDDVVPVEPDDRTHSVPLRRITGPAPSDREFPIGTVTFVGSALRSWAAQCIDAVGGVLSTEVADPRLMTRYHGVGADIEAFPVGAVDFGAEPVSVGDWLADEMARHDIASNPADVLVELVFDDGRVVGVVLATEVGTELVRARRGVVMALREDVTELSWPSETTGARAELAFVTRPASRFGRLELLSAAPESLPR